MRRNLQFIVSQGARVVRTMCPGVTYNVTVRWCYIPVFLVVLVAQIPYFATMRYIYPCTIYPTILQSCRAHHGCVCSSHLPTPANDIVFVTVPPPADGVPREWVPFNFNSFCWILCEAMWWFYQRAWKILVRGWPCRNQRMCTCRGQRMCTWLYTP